MSLDIGIREGQSAAQMSRNVRQYLNKPNMLFRRVRDEHGEMQLSKRAKAYHPGQGVYRSSYKNARRLTATETNIAYRTADHLRYQKMDYVVGIEIHLSGNHTLNGKPFHDICDELAGKYPKDFKFTGWHPQCRCFVTSILKTKEEREEDVKKILRGEPVDGESVNKVKDVPQQFKTWVKDNAERIATAKSLPYFLKDNGSIKNEKWVFGKNDKVGEVNEKKSPFATIKDAEKKIRRDEKCEHAAIYNKKGKLLLAEHSEPNSPYSIGFTEEQYNLMKDSTFTHNHPRCYKYPKGDMRRIGNSFSLEDMQTCSLGNLQVMRAVTEYYTFEIKRPSNGWLNKENITILYRKIQNEVEEELRRRVESGTTTQKKADTVFYHEIMKRFAKEINASYTKHRKN